jgi:hypothetical protein
LGCLVLRRFGVLDMMLFSFFDDDCFFIYLFESNCIPRCYVSE